MNLLFPRYRKQRSRNRRNSPARGGLTTFSLVAVSAVLWTSALGYPRPARAQNDAPGSQPALVPAALVPDKAAPESRAQNPPKADPPKIDTVAPQAHAAEIPKADSPKGASASTATGEKAGPASAGGKTYTVGPNDVVQVKVWNQPQISGIYDVHLDGMISIPLAGEIKADGLTAIQLNNAITKRLEEVALTAPVVDTSVLKINSKHYRVYGGVLKPGEFTLAERTTIMDALSQTGFKDFAKQKKIVLRRGKENFLFNYPDYIKGKNMDKNKNLELQDGDEIIVPE